ncbi:IclR family transcriptional regulator [Metallumcola ferriviriculae]|uniref:Glycerol operon regulatory protein n=1 Tax=Metallumcola ferriviriculae TaxID=3039180 RepID=A0AAU0UR07_9FIRM|nr:IclR family transcriptional regulator [Desulfitibacteraceae bacterium MK1]
MSKVINQQHIINSVDRSIDVLFAFTAEKPELGISELSQKIGLNKSTVFRLLKTLEYRGMIMQNPDNQKYRLGLKLLDLGNMAISQIEIRDAALPFMRHLSEKTRETVTLNIVRNYSRVCIEKVESSEDIRNFVQIGLHNPLYTGASGKLLLAYLPEKEKDQIINNVLKHNQADGQHINPSVLAEEIENIRRQGCACTTGERVLNSASISAPVRDYDGEVVAGISISGPSVRFTPERVTELIKDTMECAKEVSFQMGWKGK